ncbi:MAG: glycosyltransferase [Clostridiales bacterium]|nr:glycosyltransferase [Clostridiales bacterium]MDY4061141.1 glycosyltransferase [Anaerovoracaceae bacterium]
MEKTKVIHLGYYHGIDDTRIFYKECVSLNASGLYQITYITSDRNSHQGLSCDCGINLEVLPLTNKRFIRLFSYMRLLKKKIGEYKPDICHIHEFALYPLIPFLKRKGIKIILDFHENDLEVSTRKIRDKHGLFLSKIFYALMKMYEIKCVKSADKIIVVDYVLKNRIKGYGYESYLIPNYPIVNQKNIFKVSQLNEDTLCFAGGYSDLWSIRKIMEVMDMNENITFRLAGLGDRNYIHKLQEYSSWNRTVFYGRISFERVIDEIYMKSGIGMALLQYDDSWKDGPLGNTKIFEFMLAGLPVVATDFPIWKTIIEENNCGICVNCNDIHGINDAVNKILSDKMLAKEMGKNGHRLVIEKYNWARLAGELLDMYSTLH